MCGVCLMIENDLYYISFIVSLFFMFCFLLPWHVLGWPTCLTLSSTCLSPTRTMGSFIGRPRFLLDLMITVSLNHLNLTLNVRTKLSVAKKVESFNQRSQRPFLHTSFFAPRFCFPCFSLNTSLLETPGMVTFSSRGNKSCQLSRNLVHTFNIFDRVSPTVYRNCQKLSPSSSPASSSSSSSTIYPVHTISVTVVTCITV